MGKGRKRLDFILLIAALALVGIGVVMVYSTSAIIAGDRCGDPYYFLKRQALYAEAVWTVPPAASSSPTDGYCEARPRWKVPSVSQHWLTF